MGAGATLMSLLVKIGVDLSAFSKGINDTETQTNKFGTSISKTLGRVGGMVGAGVAAGVAAATAAVGAGIAALASTIQPASDLAETTSKVGVVFGDWAEDVLHFGESSATALGMSSNAALAAAGTYGNLFRSMNMTEETSAKMSMGLVQVASDLASFNNMDPTQVLDALRAGLSGETEPLKKLGVNINQATLEAKALELGLWSGKGALDASAKAQASYAMIMEQTSLAQGDFERTSSGLANQQRILTATIENIKAAIGGALLPVVNEIMGAFTGYIGSISAAISANTSFETKLADITKIVSEMAGEFMQIIPGIVTAGARLLGGLIDGIVGAIPLLIPAVVMVISTLTSIILDVAPQMVNAGLYLIMQLAEGFITAAPEIIDSISKLGMKILKEFVFMLPKLLQMGLSLIVMVATGIGEALPKVIPLIAMLMTSIWSTIITMLPTLIQAGLGIIMGLVNGMIAAIPVLLGAIPKLLTSIVTAITAAIPMLLNVGVSIIIGLINAIVEALPLIIEQLPVILTTIVQVIADNLPLLLTAAVDIILALAQGLVTAVPLLVAAVPQLITALLTALITAWPALKAAGTSAFTRLKEGLTETFGPIIKGAKTFIGDVISKIKDKLAEFKQMGVDLMQGFWHGLKEKMDSIWEGVGKWIGELIAKLKGILGIKSPSTVFYGIGKNMMLGLEKGISQNSIMPQVAVEGATAQISAMVQPSGAGDNSDLALALGNIPTAKQIARAVRDAILFAGA